MIELSGRAEILSAAASFESHSAWISKRYGGLRPKTKPARL